MNKETFRDVQIECLKVVSELQPVGNVDAPVLLMLPDGRWGISDIETETTIILALTLHVLIFNIADFFQEDALKDLTQTFSGLSQFSAKK
jgi:hypothetical protein